MLKKLDSLILCLLSYLKPICDKIAPSYKKFVLPYQKTLTKLFFAKTAFFLKLSAKEKKKILEQNLLGKMRAAALIVCFFQALFSAVLSLDIFSFFCAGFLIYLILQGYRSAYLLSLLFVLFDSLSLAFLCPEKTLMLLGWIVLSLPILAFAFKYENARLDLEKKFELRQSHSRPFYDFIAAFLCSCVCALVALVFLIICSFFSTNEPISSSKNQKLNDVAGTAVRHIFAYADYCKSQGIELVNYPKVFVSLFGTSLSKIQNELALDDSNLADFYEQAKKTFGQRLYDSVAADIEKVRKQAILETVALQKNVPVNTLVWDDKFNGLISTAEGCVLFDEMAENILSHSSPSLERIKNF